MEQQDEDRHGLPAPAGPQGVWQALHQEERGMKMNLTTDQLRAKARFRERENVWFQWIAPAICLGFGAMFVYRAITLEQVWLKLASAWMALLMTFAFGGVIRIGARRIQAGESCAQFMVREFEGSRRTLLGVQWAFVLILPSLVMSWWGGYGVIEASRLRLDSSSWRYYFMTSVWRIVAVLLVLFICWAGLGLEARKRARQADELRRAIGVVGG